MSNPYDPYGQQQYDPYGQQGYGQPAPVQHHYYGGGGPPVVARNNGMAVTSLVLGIASFLCFGFLIIPQALAVIFGHVALGQIKRTREAGSGMAVAGLILGYLCLVGWILYFCLLFVGVVAGFGGASSSTY
ncbi:DUF4190 domain-containing protein [Actinomadura flavalba]|uniref:DUF4190 domain-containing protein n=1 Tax=Actinomadura flavalba TaxID=1120938 RepID=UPI000375D1CB|nr:DUF4190 domain-containing protein [Actinomadura flavalba]